jgi:hypothetical protein
MRFTSILNTLLVYRSMKIVAQSNKLTDYTSAVVKGWILKKTRQSQSVSEPGRRCCSAKPTRDTLNTARIFSEHTKHVRE